MRLAASGLLVLVLALAAAYAHSRKYVEVVFSATSTSPDSMQIFHAADARFSEQRSGWLQIGKPLAVEHSEQLVGREAANLRFDPPVGPITTLCNLRVGQSGDLRQYEIERIDSIHLTTVGECLELQPIAGARDPKLVVRFSGRSLEKMERASAWQRNYRMLLIALLLVLPFFIWQLSRIVPPGLSARLARVPGVAWLGFLDVSAYKMCALLMVALGAGYVFLTPPGAVPDEPAHLAKIIRISEGIPFGGSGSIPLPDINAMYGPFRGYRHRKSPFTGEQMSAQLEKPLSCVATSTNLPQQANGYFPHQYVLPAIAFKTVCATGGNFGWFLYPARLLNLLLAAALVALGIYHAVSGKWALFAVALLPMSLFEMSSLSADSLTISLSIAWLGVVSGISGGKLAPGRAVPLLWILAIAVAFLKPGSAWILTCLVFCKPAFDRAGLSFKTALLKFVALPWVIHIAWSVSTAMNAVPLAGVDAASNVQLLAGEPLEFAKIWFTTFFTAQVIPLAKTLVGVLGWLDIPLSGWAYPAAGLALALALWTNHDAMKRRPHWISPVALMFALGSLVMIALPLFIYWTPANGGHVRGLQGRYFIPTVAFALVWCSIRSVPAVRGILASTIIVLLVAVNIDALYLLQQAYFVVGRG